jgi:hypothetical protein
MSCGDVELAVAPETIGSRRQYRNESRHIRFTEELRVRRFAFIDKNVLQEDATPEGFSSVKNVMNDRNAVRDSNDTY